jgi:hypothetical protein
LTVRVELGAKTADVLIKPLSPQRSKEDLRDVLVAFGGKKTKILSLSDITAFFAGLHRLLSGFRNTSTGKPLFLPDSGNSPEPGKNRFSLMRMAFKFHKD